MELFSDHIPLMKPWIEGEECAAVVEALRSGWISQGPKVAEFEAAVAGWVGAPHALATNSATSALHLALQVAGLPRGGKVVAPSHTCMATVNALYLAGGTPVFADIDSRTFNLLPEAVEAVLGGDVWGVLLVHQVGLPADIRAFRRLCKRRGLHLVEDAATAFGARYGDKRLGAHGQPTVYSFHPRKMITTGEGGMVMLWNAAADDRARRLRSAGANISDLARHQARGALQQTYPEPGYNYRLTDLQAALGLAQLGRVEAMLSLRREQAWYYDEQLASLDQVLPPYVPEGVEPSWSSYCVTIPSATSRTVTEVLGDLAAQGISARRGIQPLHREPFFRESHGHLDLPNTEAAAERTLFLPIFPGLTRPEQDRVVAALTASVRRRLRGVTVAVRNASPRRREVGE
jgi:perosamine synthetase